MLNAVTKPRTGKGIVIRTQGDTVMMAGWLIFNDERKEERRGEKHHRGTPSPQCRQTFLWATSEEGSPVASGEQTNGNLERISSWEMMLAPYPLPSPVARPRQYTAIWYDQHSSDEPKYMLGDI